MEPLVTIYIPCRNYGQYLKQSVESVFSQIYSNWELIIIDEGSSDGTKEISKEMQKRNPSKVSLITNEKPMGLQKLANHVLSIANGKYMMRLDADDWLDEAALFLMINKLEQTKKAGLVYGNYYYTDQEGNIIGVEYSQKDNKEDLASQLPPHGACTLFRTRALKSAGGYSEDITAQDGWDLWYKLSNRIGAINIQTPVFYYRQHNNSLSLDNDRLLAARTKIFEKVADKLEGDYKPKTAAIIPVKESYPDFKEVPYQEINGKSLLEIAIINALESKKIDTLIVSSESQKVLDYSLQLEEQGKVPNHFRLKRERSKNTKNIPIRDLMFQAGEYYSEINNSYPDIMIFLSIHAIHRKRDHIEKALNVLRVTESDSVVSVREERDPMFKYQESGLKLINPGRFRDLVFDEERLFRFNGSLIATWWDVLKTDTLFGEKISHIEMSIEDSINVRSNSMLNSMKKK